MKRFWKKQINVFGDINIESNTYEKVFDKNKSKEGCQGKMEQDLRWNKIYH